MNWDRIAGNWKQAKGKVKEQWGKLTADDLDNTDGQREQLVREAVERVGSAPGRTRQARLMDARLEQPPPRPLRYDAEERRSSRAEYFGEERRALDPPTEQDHPELWGLQMSEPQ